MTPRAFIPAVCVPIAAMVLAGGLSSDATAQGITAVLWSVCAAASGVVAASEAEGRQHALQLFLAFLWSGMLVVVVRLVLQ